MDITPFYGLGVSIKPYKFKDKYKSIRNYVDYMLIRTTEMFKYDNLPESMPHNILETYLQMSGFCCVFEHEGNIYCSFGGFGGEPNEYYIPTKFVVANPYLDIFKTFTIGEDCVVMRNDSLYKGLRPLFTRYATQLAENDISMMLATINSRIISLIDASDDKTRESAKKYLDDICGGDLGVIASTPFLDGVRTQPYASTQISTLISSLIELEQYYKASWYNELGLQANYNMKREAINSKEAQMNEDSLLPLIDNMITSREEGIKQINEMFGLDISVEFDSSWEDNEIELAIRQEELITKSTMEDESIEDIEESGETQQVLEDVEEESNYLENETDESEAKEQIEEIKEVLEDGTEKESDTDENSVSDDDNGKRDND